MRVYCIFSFWGGQGLFLTGEGSIRKMNESLENASSDNPSSEDPHGLVELVNRLWFEFNDCEDPFRLLEVNLASDDKGRPLLTAQTYYTGQPFSTEVRTFQDEEHLARYLRATLDHQVWAERRTRVAPLFCKRTELPKTAATADEVREVLHMTRLKALNNGDVERTVRRTTTQKPDQVVLQAKSESVLDSMVVTLSLLALAKPKKKLQDLHESLIAAAAKEAAEKASQANKKRAPAKPASGTSRGAPRPR